MERGLCRTAAKVRCKSRHQPRTRPTAARSNSYSVHRECLGNGAGAEQRPREADIRALGGGTLRGAAATFRRRCCGGSGRGPPLCSTHTAAFAAAGEAMIRVGPGRGRRAVVRLLTVAGLLDLGTFVGDCMSETRIDQANPLVGASPRSTGWICVGGHRDHRPSVVVWAVTVVLLWTTLRGRAPCLSAGQVGRDRGASRG